MDRKANDDTHFHSDPAFHHQSQFAPSSIFCSVPSWRIIIPTSSSHQFDRIHLMYTKYIGRYSRLCLCWAIADTRTPARIIMVFEAHHCRVLCSSLAAATWQSILNPLPGVAYIKDGGQELGFDRIPVTLFCLSTVHNY